MNCFKNVKKVNLAAQIIYFGVIDTINLVKFHLVDDIRKYVGVLYDC